MTKYVEKANKLLDVINPQLVGNKVTMEDCFRGVFPWQSAYDSEEDNFLNGFAKSNYIISCSFSIVSRKIQANRCLDACWPK